MRKEATRKAKLSVVRKLRLKDRRDDTAEGVELHPGADLEGQRGWPCSVAFSTGIRIPEGIIMGAETVMRIGRSQRTFGGAVGSIRERHECIFLVVQQTETSGKQEILKSKGHNITG